MVICEGHGLGNVSSVGMIKARVPSLFPGPEPLSTSIFPGRRLASTKTKGKETG